MSWVRPILLGLMGVLTLATLSYGIWLMVRPPVRLDFERIDDLLAAGRFEEAAEVLEEHLDRRPDDSQASYLLGRLLLDDPARPSEGEEADAWDLRALRLLEVGDSTGMRPDDRALRELYRGKALHALRRYDEAEQAYKAALEQNPRVPEAPWGLLNIYYTQERWQEAHDLAMRQHRIEPDPRDRVKYLLELARENVQPPDPASLVELYEPVARENPDDVRSVTRHGLALIRSSRIEEGLEQLRGAVERHPEVPLAWEALLSGLDVVGKADLFLQAYDQLPGSFVQLPEFAKHRGRAAQERGNWKEAAEAYARARRFEPVLPVLAYRLGRALRFSGQEKEGVELLDQFSAFNAAADELKSVYEEAVVDPGLGYRHNPELYVRLGAIRGRMFRPDEAVAWYRLALEARPGDPGVERALAALGEDADATSRTD